VRQCNAEKLMYACERNYMPVKMHGPRITLAKEWSDFRINTILFVLSTQGAPR